LVQAGDSPGGVFHLVCKMGDGRLLVRVRTASYAVPEGFTIEVTHGGGCENGSRDEELIRCVRRANPRVLPEMVSAASAVMAVMGCPPGCHINKDCSGGILFTGHSQDSSFAESSGTTDAISTGTGSLVGERLIEGVQGTPSGENTLKIGCVSQFTDSWPTGLSGLMSSERKMYRNMTLDRASGEDYVPSSVVVDDVAMSLGEDKTSELNGLGDSKDATPATDGQVVIVDSLPSTVPYSLSATQDILGALAEYEAGTIAPRPAELDSCDGSMDFMDEVEQSAQKEEVVVMLDYDRVVRLETAVEDERELLDRIREIVEDLEVEVRSLKDWQTDVRKNGGSRCSRKVSTSTAPLPVVPLAPRRTAEVTPSTSKSDTLAKPALANATPVVAAASVPLRPDSDGPDSRAPAKQRQQRAPRRAGPVDTPALAHVQVPQVTILKRPAYAISDESRVLKNFSSVAASGASADGYNIVRNRKRYVTKKVSPTPEPITHIPVRARHLSVKFTRARDEKYVLPAGDTIGGIRNELNKTISALNCAAYFSLASSGKWGDVLLTLATHAVEEISGYYTALREALEGLGLENFTFARDTERVKVFVGMVPLSQLGGGWQPSEWEGVSAFDRLAADIEQSNPGVLIAGRPSWAGRLHKLKERRANNAGLILVLEMSAEVRAMMAAASPRLIVAGRPRVCRTWREDNPTVVCSQCQTVGHRVGECRNLPVCAFCHGGHLTARHVCPVLSCKKVGTVCAHVQRMCILCHSVDHFTGHRVCSALRGSSSSPPVLGPATPVVADHTSVVGVSDESCGRLRRKAAGRPSTPLAPHMLAKGVSSKGLTRVMTRSEVNPNPANHSREVVVPRLDKGKGIARSPSAPADVSRAGGNGTLSAW